MQERQVQFRRATEADLDTLVELNLQAHTIHAKIRPDLFKARPNGDALKIEWRGKCRQSGSFVEVAVVDGKIAGYIWFVIREAFETATQPYRRRIYVEQMVVDGSVRRQGIGSQMLGRVHDEARGARIRDILLNVWADNGPACEFYDKHGFAPLCLMLARTVDQS